MADADLLFHDSGVERETPAGSERRRRNLASELTLTDQTFDEEIQAAGEPVLVDFWAEWCGPCKMIAPILEEIGDEQAGKLKIGKINIDENLELARRFDVMSIPTLILFKEGQPQVRIIGAKGKGQLLQELQPYL
jgi:thioredoxin 1